MSCEAIRDDMMDVLYGEADPATARRVEEHHQTCPACREELQSLRRLRRELACWELPAGLNGPSRTRPAVRGWLRAAAVVLLALGGALGLSGSEARYDGGRLSFRLGRGPDTRELRDLLAAQESRHVAEIRALKAASSERGAPAELLQAVERMLQDSEARQTLVLRASLEDLERRTERQRRYDLAQVSAGLSYLEGKTGLQMARTTELMGQVLQASQTR